MPKFFSKFFVVVSSKNRLNTKIKTIQKFNVIPLIDIKMHIKALMEILLFVTTIK